MGSTTCDDWHRFCRYIRHCGAPAGVDVHTFPGDCASAAVNHAAINRRSTPRVVPRSPAVAKFNKCLTLHGDASNVTTDHNDSAPLGSRARIMSGSMSESKLGSKLGSMSG